MVLIRITPYPATQVGDSLEFKMSVSKSVAVFQSLTYFI